MATTKTKGDLAELMVAADLRRKGYKVAFPYGEDWDYELIFDHDGNLERVQVKYAEPDGSVLTVRCRSHSTYQRQGQTGQALHGCHDRLACGL